jgi:hypothetical protein
MRILLGVWGLVQAYALDKSGNRLPSPFGPQPMGIAAFGPVYIYIYIYIYSWPGMLESLCHSVRTIAYSGAYSFNGSELIIRVDSQRRGIKFDGIQMLVSPTNEVLASQPGSLEFVWERVGWGTDKD